MKDPARKLIQVNALTQNAWA